MDIDNEIHEFSGDGCVFCGAKKLQKSVSHALHDGPFPGTGGGKVERSTAVWCPRCEVEPPSRGEPIDDPLGEWGRRTVSKEEKERAAD